MTRDTRKQIDTNGPRQGGLFVRALCGIDGTPESLEALRQADRLRDATGSILLVAAYDRDAAVQAGWAGTAVLEGLEVEAREALEEASREVDGVEAVLEAGDPATVIRRTAAAGHADLIALGAHGHSRVAGIALGSVGTRLLHDAPCSVLVARPPLFPHGFPSSIVVGLDGSPESRAVAGVARELADRHDAAVRFVLARSEDVDEAAARAIVPDLVVDRRSPVEALCALGADADLLVVGSRGLHALRALGSVSERVAHRAPCSVLVVRPSG